jgi:hypothetical protein
MAETNVEKLVRVLTTPFQDLEDTLQQLFTERNVNTAVGVQLDAIGKLVGRDRNGITDDEEYRRQIRAQIATNKSDGTTEDLITVADLLIFDDNAIIIIRNQGVAAVEVTIAGIEADTLQALLLDFLKRAKAAGVRIIVITSPDANADNLFTMYTTLNAYVTFPGIIVESIASGTAGNGIAVELLNAGFGVPGGLLLDTPTHVTVRYNDTPLDFTPNTTWENIETYFNTSVYVRTKERTGSGFSPAIAAQTLNTAGGEDPVGEGFDDAGDIGSLGGAFVSAMSS